MVWLGESINYGKLMVYRAIGGIVRYVVGLPDKVYFGSAIRGSYIESMII